MRFFNGGIFLFPEINVQQLLLGQNILINFKAEVAILTMKHANCNSVVFEKNLILTTFQMLTVFFNDNNRKHMQWNIKCHDYAMCSEYLFTVNGRG